MKQSTIATPDKASIDLTPMLDVVFIMLIFFIVTATFVKEPGVEITRPDADTQEVQKRASILIAITKESEVWVNRKLVNMSSIEPVIQGLFAENPKGSVVIQADKESNVKILTKVMNATKNIGAKKVAISTLE